MNSPNSLHNPVLNPIAPEDPQSALEISNPSSAPASKLIPISRRSFLLGAMAAFPLSAAALASGQIDAAQIQSDHGRVKPPVPIPDVRLVLNGGSSTTLPHLTAGRATAIQLMFTRCRTTCPIQAAIFQRVQRLIPDMHGKDIQLVSLSVDPESDSPAAMSEWLRRFHAGPNWIGAAPSEKDGAQLQSFFGRANGAFADHSTQVNIVDRKGRLVYRTEELPAAEEIAAVLQKV